MHAKGTTLHFSLEGMRNYSRNENGENGLTLSTIGYKICCFNSVLVYRVSTMPRLLIFIVSVDFFMSHTLKPTSAYTEEFHLSAIQWSLLKWTLPPEDNLYVKDMAPIKNLL